MMLKKLLSLAAIGCLVVACTSEKNTGEKETAAKLDGKRGGTFYRNIKVEPKTLNPITSRDLYASRVHAYVLDTLMTRSEYTYEWQPALAEKGETSPDGKTFTFFLRKGAKFHDGKPITAEDVKFSFDKVFIDEYELFHLRPYFENIEKAEIIDTHTVKFTAKNKYFGNFNVVAGLEVLPKHVYKDVAKSKKMNKTIVGSGPYKLDKYDKGRRIVLKRFDQWWGWELDEYKTKYNFKKVALRFIKDENVALQMLKRGDIDMEVMTPEVFEQKATGEGWGDKLQKIKAENKAPKGYLYIGWNMRKDMFQDKKTRRALNHLLNRELMIQKFLYGMSLPATGPWYRQSDYADPSVKPIEFDPETARKLLAEAGWVDSDKNGVLDKKIGGRTMQFKFTLLHANKDREKFLAVFQEDLKKAGIEMEIQLLEWNTFLQKLDEANFDAVNLGWSGGSVDLDPKQIWHSASAVKGGSNFIAYKNPKVDKLIDQARGELDKEKRIPILRKVYKEIAEDAPYAFLFNDKYTLYGHTKRVKKEKDTYAYDIGLDSWWLTR